MYEVNNKVIEKFKREEKKRDERLIEMTKESEKLYQLMMVQAENERNKYELKREKQEKKIMKKKIDSISNPFEH